MNESELRAEISKAAKEIAITFQSILASPAAGHISYENLFKMGFHIGTLIKLSEEAINE